MSRAAVGRGLGQLRLRSIDSVRTLIGTSGASYDIDLIGAHAEAGYRIDSGAWRIVPRVVAVYGYRLMPAGGSLCSWTL